MDKRILIFTGGHLGEWALEVIRPNDFVIGVDRGSWFLWEHGIIPEQAFGDFDSVNREEFLLLQTNIKNLVSCDPVMKDLSDTEMAYTWALQQKPKEIILLGATGTRFDHTLANVHLLLKGLEAHVHTRIIDEHNEIQLMDNMTHVSKSKYSHLSLLPLTLEVTGITLEGFRYPLHQATLQMGQSLGISNVLVEDKGSIALLTGLLLVIQSMD